MSHLLSDLLMIIAVWCLGVVLLILLVIGIALLLDFLRHLRDRSYQPTVMEREPCKTGCHDWILPTNGRSGYCERCGTAFPHLHDHRRSTTAVLEAKPADGSWGRA